MAALLALTTAEPWSVNRQFYIFSPRAYALFADDAVTTHLRQMRPPYRVMDLG